MMGKLIVDAVVLNAKKYKNRRFRFDLMSFHVRLQHAADQRRARQAPRLKKMGGGEQGLSLRRGF